MIRLVRSLCVLLVLPALVWGQTQVINGNRVQAGWVNYGTTAGTATAYTLTFTPALPGYVPGQCFLFKPHVTNTGAATLNVQGKGALALTKLSSGALVPLVAGDLLLNRLVQVCHDGTTLQLMGAVADGTGSAGVPDGDKGDLTVSGTGTVWTIDTSAVTYAKLQNVSTAPRLLGRNTAGAGPVEELTVATVKAMLGLTFGDIAGDVPYASLTPATSASRLLGRGATTPGDWQEIVLGTNLSMSGTTLHAAVGLGFTPEDSANKSTATTLGTSDTLYPTQHAVKQYVDASPKTLTNTALTPRQCTAGPGSPITLNADNLTGCDFVQMAELSGATTFDLTAGSYVNGQFLSILIFTATQRALTWTTGAGKFAAEGMLLPTFTRAGGYVLYGFRFNALSNRWALVASNQTTNYGTAGYVQTAHGPGVEPSWQPATGGGGSSDGTIHAADYGVVCDGTTNTTAAMQAALDVAKVGTLGRTLAMPLPTGNCMIHSTLTIQSVVGMRLIGNGVTFQWAGGPGVPLFLFQDVRDSTWGFFNVNASVGVPVATALQLENGSGGSVTPTANYFHDITVECTNGGCAQGIRMAVGPGGDNNNDFNTFERVHVNNASFAAARIDHAQSKTNRFLGFTCSQNGIGAHCIHVVAGSFLCERCAGGGSTGADFNLPGAADYIVIANGNFENSVRLVETGGSSGAAWPFTIRNTRWTNNNLHADNKAIIYKFRGPLILENNMLEDASYNKAMEIQFLPGGDVGQFVARGNALASTLANPFTGIQPSLTEANLINRNDGAGMVLLDIQVRLGGDVSFADLGTAPYNAALNGNIAYCSTCTPGATCTGGGSGALAVRINGAWKCL